MRFRRALIVGLFLAIASVATSAAPSGTWAAAVSLAWDPNPPGENVVAYRVWECPKLSTTGCTQLQEVTTTQADLEVAYGTHCWRATAVNVYGISSDFSGEACADLTRPSQTNAFRVIVYVPRLR